jgi:hypothetical protein|uniref:NS3 n=1 Tax=uncultured densovirus TaxID=748192 RepID=A0A7L7YQL5_9VIRU|nr:NS3 [uncultured densovirus]
MNCLYGKSQCNCPKCAQCGSCTSGSQIHRSCFKDYILSTHVEDEEEAELMAGVDESLPTAEQEERAEQIQRNTPISLQLDTQLEELETFENGILFEKTYQFEMCKTDVDFVFETLRKNYPDEDFDGPDFQRLDIHKYLTSEMTKLEFFIAHNQWGYDFVHYPQDIPIKMRKGVITRFNRSRNEHNLYHISCVNSADPGFTAGGFTKGMLTVEAKNVKDFIDLMLEHPTMFFCRYCEKYMFDCIEHYSGKAWEIPSEDIWPSCNYILQSGTTDDETENTYYTLFAHKVIGVVLPFVQEPPKKKVCRRLDFDSDTESLPAIDE